MTNPPTKSPCNSHELHHNPTNEEENLHLNENQNQNQNQNQIKIPVEIISEEEMALIETAFSFASSRLSLVCSQLGRNPRSKNDYFALVSKRALPTFSGSDSVCDVEDLDGFENSKKKSKVPKSFFSRFRKNKGLYVTDFTSTEWCEKKMEFVLERGKPEITNAMKAGITRHAKLEEEVIKKVEVRVDSREDIWALKFMNFVICANQLSFDGLTRELPVVGLIQGVWMVGVIDELRTRDDRILTLVDTKTRSQPRLPAEPQRRNGRLQLMCYKYLWDNLVDGNFRSEEFFEFFSLDSQRILSDEMKRSMADSGLAAETLGEVARYFANACSMLPPSHDQLLLRYEYQEDNSLIGEDEFAYDDDFLKAQIQSCLEFWMGEREAKFVPEDERWKCRYCHFSSDCPLQTQPTSSHNASKLDPTKLV